MAPLMIVLPVPVNVKLPAPERSPESVADPDARFWTVPPALVTESGIVESSPLLNTKAPPAKTGLTVTPRSGTPTRSPVIMSVRLLPPLPPLLPPPLLVQTLHAVISKFQILDAELVCVKVKVYPFEVPLVFVRLPEGTPLNTDLSSVFRMELFVVDREEMPKMVLPVTEVTANWP